MAASQYARLASLLKGTTLDSWSLTNASNSLVIFSFLFVLQLLKIKLKVKSEKREARRIIYASRFSLFTSRCVNKSPF
jgi:hypothetical protein